MNKSTLEQNLDSFSELWKDIFKVHQVFSENKISFQQLLKTQVNYDCFKAYENIFDKEFKSSEITFDPDKLFELDFLWLDFLKTGPLHPVAYLPNIQSIRLNRMLSVPDIEPLKSLTKLKYLEMVLGNIKDLSPIQDIQSLEILKCTAQEKFSNLKPISNLVNLKELYIGHTAVKNLKPISALKNLQKLSLYGSKVTDISPLSQLESLQHLDLHHTKVSSIQNLPKQLKQLLCGTTYISKEEIKTFLKEHPNCKVNEGKDDWKLNESKEILDALPYVFSAGISILDLDENRAISFIDTKNKEQYFTIQYTKGEQGVYIELNSQALGAHNGLEKVVLEREKAKFILNNEGKKHLKYSAIEIVLDVNEIEYKDLQKELKNIE